MRNFRMLISYDGTRYQGWQRLGNTDNTIQQKLETALTRILEVPVEISGSGRTDAGVHARGQVANFHAETKRSVEEILVQLRRYLPGDIGVISLEEAAPRFHARLSCKEKTYVYRVWNSDLPNVFDRRYVYPLAAELDVTAMEQAASHILGTHDFLAFCSNKHFKKSSVRTVHRCDIRRVGEEVQFHLTADGFLYNMVRILVGTLLEVGQHRKDADCMVEILASRVREQAGETAPAKGLCLWEVVY